MADYLHCENTPVLETTRLLLRSPVPADAPDLAQWLGLEEVYTYWGRKPSSGEKNPASLFAAPRPCVKRKPNPDYNWMLVLKDTGKVIGQMEVFNVENGRMADVGYRIHPACWGQGLATEALQRVIRFIFEETGLQRLNASADVRNVGSNRVLEKCGFLREGTVRQGKLVSVYCDYHIYGLLKSDYAESCLNCEN